MKFPREEGMCLQVAWFLTFPEEENFIWCFVGLLLLWSCMFDKQDLFQAVLSHMVSII